MNILLRLFVIVYNVMFRRPGEYLFDDLDLDELFTDLVCTCMALTFELLLYL